MASDVEKFKYNFDHKYRGRALIIGNEFITQTEDGDDVIGRKGCADDLMMMEEMFTRLDFKVTILKNLKAVDMKRKLQTAAIATENKDSDCFVFVISTHDEEIREEKGTGLSSGAEVWRYAVCAEDEERIYVDDIVKMFDVDNAPGLAGKPKLFFLQACRTRGLEDSKKDTEAMKHLKRLIRIRHCRYDQGHHINVETATKIATPSIYKNVKRVWLKLRRRNKSESQNKHWIYNVDVTRDVENLHKDWKDSEELKGEEVKSADGTKGDTVGNVCEDDSMNLHTSSRKSSGDFTGVFHKTTSVKERSGNNLDSSSGDYSTDEYSEDDDTTDNDDDTSDDEDAFEVEEDAGGRRDISESLPSPPLLSLEGDPAARRDTREALPSPSLPSPPLDTPMPPIPLEQFDVVPINCPQDFLIMYPIVPGKASFRFPSGSYLLQCLHKGENVSKLINGSNILQYLTSVCQDMAMFEFLPDLIMKSKSREFKMSMLKGWVESNIKLLSRNRELLVKCLGKEHTEYIPRDETLVEEYLKENIDFFKKKEMRKILRHILPFKTTACLVHRLRDNVRLYPKSSRSPMAKVSVELSKH